MEFAMQTRPYETQIKKNTTEKHTIRKIKYKKNTIRKTYTIRNKITHCDMTNTKQRGKHNAKKTIRNNKKIRTGKINPNKKNNTT